jgi:hypothetical protein
MEPMGITGWWSQVGRMVRMCSLYLRSDVGVGRKSNLECVVAEDERERSCHFEKPKLSGTER